LESGGSKANDYSSSLSTPKKSLLKEKSPFIDNKWYNLVEKYRSGDLKMSITTIEKAVLNDAERLTVIMKKTFDEEANRWLPSNQPICDDNIQPPNYHSIEMTKYSIRELEFYKVMYDGEVVGGIILTLAGKRYARIDRIFVEPDYQGKGIGSKVIVLIEALYPSITNWDLETSSRQINNHFFYEKNGYHTTFKTEDEYCYQKQINTSVSYENLVEQKDLSKTQYEECNMAESDYYGVNLEGSSISNSNLENSRVNNCNLSYSKFQNINFRHTLIADLNLSNSHFSLVTLGGVTFSDTNLGQEKEPLLVERCDFTGSTLIDSNLTNVNIVNCELSGMKINDIPIEDLLEAYEQVKILK